MSHPAPISEPTAHTEAVMARLLEEIVHRLQTGASIDLEAYVRRHPELEARLRRLVPAMEALVDMGVSFCGDSLSPSAAVRSATKSVTGALGDFRILGELGRGGMGVVYEAEQISLSRRVALKILPLAAVLDDRQLKRFKNEALAAAQLDHPHIVDVYGVGCERGVHYYAMRYIDGCPLCDVIADARHAASPAVCSASPQRQRGNEPRAAADSGTQRQPEAGGIERSDGRAGAPATVALAGAAARTGAVGSRRSTTGTPPQADTAPPAALATEAATQSTAWFRTVAKIGIQVAEALDHAHQQGIVHRDIKPGNVLLDSTGKAWVTDFGLAHFVSLSPWEEGRAGPPAQRCPVPLTMTGDIVGTLRYMSPEQTLGSRMLVDHRADIYSVGITLYEALTLQPAFAETDRMKLLMQVADSEPKPPRQLNAAVPRDLETIVLKAIAKAPADRYPTAVELAADLRRFLDDQPIRAQRPSPLARLRKWTRRHKGPSVTTAVLLMAALLVGAGLKLQRDRQLRQVEQSVRESLASARAFVQSGEYLSAREKLGEAQGRLEQARWKKGPLVAAVTELSEQVTAKIRAVERFDHFQELRAQVQVRMYRPSVRADALASCRKALELYGVLEEAVWRGRPDFQNLDSGRRQQVQEAVVELLFLFAQLELRNTYTVEARASACRRAIDALRRIETVYRPTPGPYLFIERMWRELGEDKLADEALRKAESIVPESPLDYLLLAQFQVYEGQFDQAADGYDRVLRAKPDDYLALYGLGKSHMVMGHYPLAEGILTGAIAVNAQAINAYFDRAETRFAQGKLASAQADYAKVLQLHPHDPHAYTSQGVILRRKGNDAQALGMFEKSLEVDPGSYWTRLQRGRAYQTIGDHEKAAADFTEVIRRASQAIRIQPEDWIGRRILAEAYLARASYYARIGDLEHATLDLKEAEQVATDNPQAQILVAWFLATAPYPEWRDPVKAITLAQKAFEHDPQSQSGRYWNTLGVAQYRVGEWEKASETLEKTIQVKNGGNSFDFFFLAMAHWQLGHKDESRRWYDKAVAWMEKNRPKDEELLRFRAEAEALLGIESQKSEDRDQRSEEKATADERR